MKHALTFTATALLAVRVARSFAVQPAPTRLALELEDYAALPVTADNTNINTRAQLARVNCLRDKPGGRRFFVSRSRMAMVSDTSRCEVVARPKARAAAIRRSRSSPRR
jgi:hypothetical protein